MNYYQSRTAKSLKNGLVAIIFFAINIILQFFSRKIFIIGLGDDILGLNSTLYNMLEFLNLAELGIGTAVSFSLFKPLFNNDRQSINEIITFQGLLYRRIAFLIISASIVLSCFFPLIFEKTELPLWYCYASFYTFLFSSMAGYFFNYKQVLLSAAQQEYKIIYSYRLCQFIKLALQTVAVYYSSQGYIWWLTIEVAFVIISSIALNRATRRAFPFLATVNSSFNELKEKYNYLSVKIKQLFFHKIGSFALYQSSPLIIYSFISLKEVTIYMNYMMISAGIMQLFNAVFNGVGAGVGNVVAEDDKNYSLKILREIFSLRFALSWVAVVLFICCSKLFIKIWLGADYILPSTTTWLIGIILFLNLFRYSADIFIQANGIYSDIYAPIAEAFINLTFSIILGYIWQLNGILTGVILSQIVIIIIWKPYYLLTRTSLMSYKNYFGMLTHHIFIAALCSIPAISLTRFIDNLLPANDLFKFIIVTLSLAILLTLFISVGLIITGASIKDALKRLKSLLQR